MNIHELYESRYGQWQMPKYKDIPNIGLYSDQTIQYINDTLSPLFISGKENFLTTAMINNYVKIGLIKPTQKKRYDRDQIAYLMVVCVFKQLYTIPQIAQLISEQISLFKTEQAYNYFATELEQAILYSFNFSDTPWLDSTVTYQEERLYVRSSVMAFAQKLLVESYLQMKIAEKGNE
ncbi:MAG: DUF1836 domain-containing protein [Erysipelotrichaceae bacterium]|nr:DUF1836 domain-containing protein [Erysipelotrichaceae bacterium]